VADKVKAQAYDGAVVCTDSAMFYLLSNGIVPDLVVTLDPHGERIIRWYGDPRLSQKDLDRDDYFRRQDMDRAFADELAVNRQVCATLEEYGPRLKIALSTSTSPAVVQRILDVGMDVYWWNPMYDDPDVPGSITRGLVKQNGLPSVNAGGNVGSACWMMATAVLGKQRIALTGVDFSYYDGTPYASTQYYHEIVELVGEEHLESVFIRVHNPHDGKWYYTDPAYMWYRECLLEMIADSDARTYNCTEGGILFGDGVEVIPLIDFLDTPH
jgi:hypothetical protein